jgi:hypothetical protein
MMCKMSIQTPLLRGSFRGLDHLFDILVGYACAEKYKVT